MKRMWMMAVDVGTSYIKIGIYDRDGASLCIVQEPAGSYSDETGAYVQSGEMLYETVLRCMRKAVGAYPQQASEIEAIVFTGQMAGFMGVGKNWEDITGWSCSLDTRYLGWAEKIRSESGELIGGLCGTSAPLMAPKILWFSQAFPEKAKKIEKYVMLNGYILGRLGGIPVEEAAIDPSLLTWSGLADIRKGEWSAAISEALGIDAGKLPRIVPSDHICAFLTDKAAKAVGLRTGIPLVIGAGDKVAGCTGAGLKEEGEMVFEASSYGALSCFVSDFIKNRIHDEYDCLIHPDGYLAHKYIPGSGITLKWFIDSFGDGSFEKMEKLAESLPPGCAGLMAIGLLGGSAMPFDSSQKGMWMGAGYVHKPEHFYRALLESFCYDIALSIDSIEETYGSRPSGRILMIGGGAQSGIWGQMLADVTGRCVRRRNAGNTTLLGAAAIGYRGIGMADSCEAAIEEGKEREVICKPNAENAPEYEVFKKRYARYRSGLHEYFAGL